MSPTNTIVIDIGTSFSSLIEVTDDVGLPFDLAGYTPIGSIRKHPTSSKSIPLVCTVTDEENGKIGISLDADATIDAREGAYGFDVLITNVSGNVIKVASGVAILQYTNTKLPE